MLIFEGVVIRASVTLINIPFNFVEDLLLSCKSNSAYEFIHVEIFYNRSSGK